MPRLLYFITAAFIPDWHAGQLNLWSGYQVECHAVPFKPQKPKRHRPQRVVWNYEAANPNIPKRYLLLPPQLSLSFCSELKTQEMGVNGSSSSSETTSQSTTTNFVPNCALLLSSPKFMPFFRASSKKPNFVAPNVIVIGELVQSSVVTVADKCFRLLHLFTSQNPLLEKVLSLPNEFHSFCHQVSLSLSSEWVSKELTKSLLCSGFCI